MNIDERTGKSKIILDLCGGSGSWGRFYSKNGYDVRLITLPYHDVMTYRPPKNVYGILAAPPCTEFSVLNCKAENRHRNFDKGMLIVNACLDIIRRTRPKIYKNWDSVPNKLPLYTRPGREKPNFAFLHKSALTLIPQLSFANPKTDADFRAITPPCFAKAFF